MEKELNHEINHYVKCLCCSPDRKILASGGSDNQVILWNIYNGEKINILKGHSCSVNSLSFSPDGKILATAGDNFVRLWHIDSAKEIYQLHGHSN